MTINKIEAKSILLKRKHIDSWFLTRYGMNLYRGCSHDCSYCDGRAEGYYVEGDFAKDIQVKINAPELLRRALDPRRKRKPLKRTYMSIGGGVSDSYQPLEKKLKLTRQCLEVIKDFSWPVYILTKSNLIERDLDLFKEIQKEYPVLISMSFSTIGDDIAKIFEPGCTPPSQRLKTLKLFHDNGIPVGVFLMPVIPGVTDKKDKIFNSMKAFKDAGVEFVLFGGMTLKDGRQKDHYYNVIRNYDESLIDGYNTVYPGHDYGAGLTKYYIKIGRFYNEAAKELIIPRRIPAHLYNTILDKNDLVTVILQNLDFLYKHEGKKSPFGYAAHVISQLDTSIEEAFYGNHRTPMDIGNKTLLTDTTLKPDLTSMSGHPISKMNRQTVSVIEEILTTGTSRLFEELNVG